MEGTWIVQWARTGRFQLYNYGSAATNSHVYKKPEPPDIAEGYNLLDIPLDLVAGKSNTSQQQDQSIANSCAHSPGIVPHSLVKQGIAGL